MIQILSSIVWSSLIGGVALLSLSLLLVFLIICCGFLLAVHRTTQAPQGIPWIGVKESRLFPKARASVGAFTNEQQYLKEGYERVSFPEQNTSR